MTVAHSFADIGDRFPQRPLLAYTCRDVLRSAGKTHAHQWAGGLVFDEIKIQEGLVWSERTGRLVGFADQSLLSAAAQVRAIRAQGRWIRGVHAPLLNRAHREG